MGFGFSCYDTVHLPTIQEPVINSLSDGEMTVFLANSRNLYEEAPISRREVLKKHRSNIENSPSLSIDTDLCMNLTRKNNSLTNQNQSINPQGSPAHYRIYSSNASRKSLNLIEEMKKSQSHCSTNVNSRNNSRCVSPNPRAKQQ